MPSVAAGSRATSAARRGQARQHAAPDLGQQRAARRRPHQALCGQCERDVVSVEGDVHCPLGRHGVDRLDDGIDAVGEKRKQGAVVETGLAARRILRAAVEFGTAGGQQPGKGGGHHLIATAARRDNWYSAGAGTSA
jgi:hypothetical protein